MQKKKYNGEGTIYDVVKNGKKYYKAQISLGYDKNGKRIRKCFCGYNKTEVLKKMQQALFKYGVSTYSYDNISFGDFFKDWLYNYKKIELKPNSFARYESLFRLKIQDYKIYKIKLRELNTRDIQRHLNELINNNEISIENGKRLITLIHSSLNFAIRQEYIYRNYAEGIVFPKIKKQVNNKVFSKEEQRLFIDHLNTKNTIDLLLLTAFCTGLRLGEITALTWEDLKDGKLTINKQYQNEYKIDDYGNRTRELHLISTKTESSERIIPLPDNILPLIFEHKKEQEKNINRLKGIYQDKKLIFADSIGNPIEHKKPNREVKKICKHINIPDRTFHSIRHSYATRLFELNVPVKTVQHLLGHSTINTTMNIYTHVMEEQKTDEVQKLNKLL